MVFYLDKLNGLVNSSQSDHFFSCRVKVGERLLLSDLKGLELEAVITDLDKKNRSLKYQIEKSQRHQPLKPKILFQALTDKLYLDKLAEIIPLAGITQVFLFPSKRSPKQIFNLPRLQKILIRSCEQGHIFFLPELTFLEGDEYLTKLDDYKPLFLDLNGHVSTHSLKSNSILVGPEGGWHESEIQTFQKLNLSSFSLENRVYPSWLAGSVYFWQN